MLATQPIETLVNRLVNRGADALMKLAEAAALAGSRVMDEHDDLASASKRIRTQMERSMLVSGDVTAGGLWRRDDGLFTCDEITRWAKQRYPGLFDDLPTKSRTVTEFVEETMQCSIEHETEWEPIDPELLRTLLRAARLEIKQRYANDEHKERERILELVRRFGKRKKKNS